MKKVLVLGGAGMLGHKVVQTCRTRFDVHATFRGDFEQSAPFDLIERDHAVTGVDAMNLATVERALRDIRPDVVVNCIGIVKQRAEAQDPDACMAVNALLPHRAAAVCRDLGARMIHVSTDCVFSGRKGMYRESDAPDGDDLYGRSKHLGELEDAGVLTLRTSLIGRELRSTSGLVEWFLSQRGGTVAGYTEAIFSGLTTLAFSSVIADLIARDDAPHGLYHVSADPISKYELLVMLDRAFDAGVTIQRSTELRIDRSLDSTRFRETTGWRPATWPEMVASLADDPTPYDLWRNA